MSTTWPSVPLGDLVSADSPICYGILMPGEHVADGIPVIKVKDFEGGILRVSQLHRTSREIDHQYRRSRVYPDDILLSIRGTTGEVALVPPTLEVANITQDAARVRVNARIDRDYLLQALRSEVVQAQIRHRTIGQAVKGINIGCVRKLQIPYPSRDEQIAIARVLSSWDRGIQQLSDLIAAKLRFKQGLVQQLLTGTRRFNSFRDEWKTLYLKDVAEECKERNRGRLGIGSVMAVTKADGIIPMRERTIAADIDRYSVVKKEYFAYNPMRLNIGSIARWLGEQDVLVSPDYVVFHCRKPCGDGPAIDPNFLDQYRRSSLWKRYVTSSGNGSVRVRIYFADLGRLKLRLPPLPEQQRIAAVLDAADREIDILRRELDALKTQKKGLIQKLLTGQVRINP